MTYEITDSRGERVDLGDLVEVNESWKKVPGTRIGIVREVTFRDNAQPTLKVSGIMNRTLSSEDVTVLAITNSERALLDAFLDAGVTPTMEKVRETLATLRAEGSIDPKLG